MHVLALARRELWAKEEFSLFARDPDIVRRHRKFVELLTEIFYYAA